MTSAHVHGKWLPLSLSLSFSFLLIGLTISPAAANDFALTSRSDEQILDLVGRLSAGIETLRPEDRQSDVILAHTVLLDCQRFEFGRSENRVVHRIVVDEANARVLVGLPLDGDELRVARGFLISPDGQLVRLGDDRFRTTREGENRRLWIDFGDVAAGSTYGWSVTTHADYGLAYVREPLEFDLPVLQSRVHVKGEGLLTHRVVPVAADDIDVTVEIRDRHRGFPTWLRASAGPRPAFVPVVFGPHPDRARAHLRITRQGRFYQEIDVWMLANDWNMWLATELGDPRAWTQPDQSVREAALRVTEGLVNDAQRGDALFRFVRDSIRATDEATPATLLGPAKVALQVDPLEFRERTDAFDGPLRFDGGDWRQPGTKDIQPPDDAGIGTTRGIAPRRALSDVLESREGTQLERAALLTALMRAVDIEVFLGFARDRALGRLDHDAAGRWQFSDLIVVLLSVDGTAGRWYCTTRPSIPAGYLPPGLRQTEVLFVSASFSEEFRRVWDDAWNEALGRTEVFVSLFNRTVRIQDWAQIITSPGNPSEMAGRSTAIVHWPRDEGELAHGVSVVDGECANAWFAGTDDEIADESLAAWNTMYPDIEVVSVSPTVARDTHTVSFEADLDLGAAPTTDGAVWPLDGKRVFARDDLADYRLGRSEPFVVPFTHERLTASTFALPANWTRIRPVVDYTLDHPRLSYRARVVQKEDRVHVERIVQLRAGTSEGDEQRQLGEVIRAIHDFEHGVLALQRLDTSP